ncbi:MAG: DUF6483 family protein [Acutalibacteraceae bacterium]|nr:hypothetical protein [Clostridia bacterium]MEE3403635.1 DUF6483 family protein [Acutalibacteraceae bacterium]
MGFQDDWVLRQIEIIARYVANLIFHKNRITYTFETTDMLSEMDQLHLVLDRLVQENRVGEAEDLLFENIRMTDKYIELATDFYSRLNGMTDAELETADFSRDEVYDGYIDILTKLGVPVEQFTK